MLRMTDLRSLGGRTLMVLAAATSGPAKAGPFGRPDAEVSVCEKIKPDQQLTEESKAAVDSALSAKVPGVNLGGIQVSGDSSSKYAVQLLGEDALARSWYTYQICVLHEAGAISDQMRDELMREVWGLKQLSPSAYSRASRYSDAKDAQAKEQPKNSNAENPSSQDKFVPEAGMATIVVTCPRPSEKYADLKSTFRFSDGTRKRVSTGAGFAVDVEPGLLQIEVTSDDDIIEFYVDPGYIYYVASDMKSDGDDGYHRTVELTSGSYGRRYLGYCSEVERVY